MSEERASYQVAVDVMAGWRDNVLNGTPPRSSTPSARVSCRRSGNWPGTGDAPCFGGATGAGKTAFVMQVRLRRAAA